MSEAAAKATRRQLRRSIGETALGAVIEQGSALAHIDDRVAKLTREVVAFQSLTFWQRLTWLVTGSIHGLS